MPQCWPPGFFLIRKFTNNFTILGKCSQCIIKWGPWNRKYLYVRHMDKQLEILNFKMFIISRMVNSSHFWVVKWFQKYFSYQNGNVWSGSLTYWSHWGLPGFTLLSSASCSCAAWKAVVLALVEGVCPLCGRSGLSSQLLDLAGPQPGDKRHLGTEPVDKGISLHLFLFLCISTK